MNCKKQVKIHNRESLERELHLSFQVAMDKLEGFWKNFGISEEHVVERSNTVLKHVTYLLEDLVKEEEELMITIKNQIQNHELELRKVCIEMSEQFNEPDKSLPLLQKEKLLRTQLDELMVKKKARVDKYKELRKQEGRLCEILCMPQTPPISSAVPSEREIYELEQHLQMLSDEKERRYNKYCHAKKQLSTILEETDFCPETSFEREVICYEEDGDFILSQEKLDQLKKVVEKVQQLRDNMVEEIKHLSKKLNELWDRLDVDKKLRQEFTKQYSEIRHSTVIALKEEIERCEEVRKQNVAQYISKLREELVSLWKNCYISENERHQFEPFYSEDYNEHLLELHEIEVGRLKRYYEDTKDIFVKIAKRDELWKLMLVLERKTHDPNRFNNRGGNLLQEERQRNKLVKDLPKLEEEIITDISKYEEENGSMFLMNGINFAEFVEKQWNDYREEKENQKLERQKQRSEKMDSIYTPCKRPLYRTPASAPSKLLRSNVGLSTMSRLTKVTPKTPSIISASQKWKKGVARRLSPRFTTPKNTPGVLKERNYTEGKIPSSNNTTLYTDFAKELNKAGRERCRSSVVTPKHRVFGGKVTHNGSLKKNRQSINNSSSRSRNISKTLLRSNNKSIRNTSRTPTKITSARGKLGLPFLI